MFTLRVLREQGAFSGDLTLIQEFALRLAIEYEDDIKVDNITDVVKSLQAFINPSIYEKVYKKETVEDDPEEIPQGVDVADVMVDVSDPDSLDEYLMYAFEQTKVQNSVFSSGKQKLQVKGMSL